MEELIKRHFEFIEQDLDVRFHSIQEILNTQKKDLFKKIDKFASHLKRKLIKERDFKKLDLFIRKHYLIKYNLSGNDDWIDTSFIGYFNVPFFDLKNNHITKLSMDNRFITSLCSLNNQRILMIDENSKDLLLVDSNLKRIANVSYLFGIKHAKDVFIDSRKIIYICDISTKRVVLCDYRLREIIHVIHEFGQDEVPNETFVIDKIEYIICSNSEAKLHIKIFEKNHLYKTLFQNKSSNFKKIKLSNKYIYCTDSLYNFYIFTHDGNQIGCIEKFGLGLASYFELNGFLITLHKFGSVYFYGLDEFIGKDIKLINKICTKLNSNCTPLGFWSLQNRLYIFLQWNEHVNFNPHIMVLDLN